MKFIIMLFGIALCLGVIAPTYAKPGANADQLENQNGNRPKRQYPGVYGYHSQRPENYDQRRKERYLLTNILRLLEEVSDFMKRPPQPQLIYIPYPIQYPVPRYCQCGDTGAELPDISHRWPPMEDKRQNWGYDDSEEVEEEYRVNARPINFGKIPAPTSGVEPPLTKEAQIPNEPRRLQNCDSSVLSCCENVNDTRAQRQICFALSQCAEYFEKQNDNACSKENVQEVLKLYTATYSKL